MKQVFVVSNDFPADVRRLLAIVVFASVLAACGGGGGGGGGAPAPAVTTHTVSASAGIHGQISPASATVNDGATAAFNVAPDSGYRIDSVSGCAGSLADVIYTTGSITTDCTVAASFVALPTASIVDASVEEGNSGAPGLVFTVALSAPAYGDVTVTYATSSGTAVGRGSCTLGTDYEGTAGTLTLIDGTTSATFNVRLCGDTTPETDETFSVALSNISANALLGSVTATGTLINDDVYGRLNDTGLTVCGDYAVGGSGTDNNNVDCVASGATVVVVGTDGNGDPVPAGQDAHFGRDVTHPDNSDGRAGFSYTKIGSDGQPLADQTGDYASSPWYCVMDNVTGLMWEVKTDDGGLHDKDWTYTWYNTDHATNGGNPGAVGGATCGGSLAGGCDTAKFVAAVNATDFCGYDDWRMPSVDELQSVINMMEFGIDPILSRHPVSHDWYWTESPYAADGTHAWVLSSIVGSAGHDAKSVAYIVLLVRAGK